MTDAEKAVIDLAEAYVHAIATVGAGYTGDDWEQLEQAVETLRAERTAQAERERQLDWLADSVCRNVPISRGDSRLFPTRDLDVAEALTIAEWAYDLGARVKDGE